MLDLCVTLDPGFSDLENLTFLKNDEFVYLLGMCFCSNGKVELVKFNNID